MKRNKKRGFTLVELLAVIVILAIILVIAVPQIMSTIKDTTKASLESSAKMVAAQVEKEYTVAQTLGKEFDYTGSCMQDWAGLNDVDYESCTYEISSDGTAKVTLVGKGKFKGLSVCSGTRSGATAADGSCGIKCKDNEILSEGLCVKATNESCFDFDSKTGTILFYYINENNDSYQAECPVNIVVPKTIDGVIVTKIGPYAFTECESKNCGSYTAVRNPSLNSIILPNTVTEIGSHAFYASHITSVNFNELINLKVIYEDAFKGNEISGELDLSKTALTTIEDEYSYGTFSYNQITSVKLPTSITKIGESAFSNNPNLTTIINPTGKSFDWYSITKQRTSDTCIFSTGTCGNITISAS